MSELESNLVNTAGQLKDEIDGVGIIIADSVDPESVRSILLLERGLKVRFSGQLENCGGSVEPGEEPLESAKREMYEELRVTPTEMVHLFSYHPFPEASNKQDHIYMATIKDIPQIIEEGKCSALIWATIDMLANLPLTKYAEYDFARLGWISQRPEVAS
jgi:8-oxo-dGTP pyrophosphatase MutT (NUDIX family)